MDNKKYITLNKVAVGYNNQVVLNDISFDIYSGELICILGSNGKGKSTLLKSLMGILPIISGDIVLKGKPLESIRAEDKAKHMAVVLTDSISHVNMKVRDVVSTGRYPYMSWNTKLSAADKSIIEFALTQVGAIQYADRWIAELSDGERQRVILARSLAQETDLLLLDEPTAFLDLAHTMEVCVLLKKLTQQTSKSIIMSTHDWAVAMQIADRIFWIDETSNFNVLDVLELKNGNKLNEMLNTNAVEWNYTTESFKLKL